MCAGGILALTNSSTAAREVVDVLVSEPCYLSGYDMCVKAEYHLIYRALLQKRPIKETLLCEECQGRSYGVATISRLLKIIGLFCRISSHF